MLLGCTAFPREGAHGEGSPQISRFLCPPCDLSSFPDLPGPSLSTVFPLSDPHYFGLTFDLIVPTVLVCATDSDSLVPDRILCYSTPAYLNFIWLHDYWPLFLFLSTTGSHPGYLTGGFPICLCQALIFGFHWCHSSPRLCLISLTPCVVYCHPSTDKKNI